MPLGGFRLNSIAKSKAIASARSSAAVYSVATNGISISSPAKFGSTAAQAEGAFTGRTGKITVNPAVSTFRFDTNKIWTVECWLKRSSPFNGGGLETFLNIGSSIPNDFYTSARSIFGVQGGANSTQFLISVGNNHAGRDPGTNWFHVAFVCHGNNTMSAFYNGEYVFNKQSVTDTTDSKEVHFGRGGNESNFQISIDELRVSNIERYSNTFSVATSQFANDANTLALFHFENNTNDDTA